jgi:hypothetical protein
MKWKVSNTENEIEHCIAARLRGRDGSLTGELEV